MIAMAFDKMGLFTLALFGKFFLAKQMSPSFEESYKQRGSPSFNENYKITWGDDHILSTRYGRDVRLSLDKASGSGIQSKLAYGSGFFHMRLKLPANDSAGVVTTFYLKSLTVFGTELDFEFLGNRKGKPYTVQTNVFAHDNGDREQRIHLWFDPTADFHSYRILWNPQQIVFFVDETPIRVFNNKTKLGVNYPTEPMSVLATIWNGDSWATDGGREKINWSNAPFQYHLRSFTVDGCPSNNSSGEPCNSTKYWWNNNKHQSLNPEQEKQYQYVKRTYLIYDYCSDKKRFPTLPRECPQ